MAEHLLGLGHPTYLVEYGTIGFSDRELGLEHWVADVLPRAIEQTSADAGGRPVQVVGWCLGGIMSLLALAARPDLPVNSIAVVASPFDFHQLALFAPIRQMASITNGIFATLAYRAMGGAPAPLVKRAFQLSALDKHLTKPLAVGLNLHDRDFLAQIEAVDAFTDNMTAYPGRTMGQLYHQLFRGNDLADGRLRLGEDDIDLADVRVPVLAIAGKDDVLAPRGAVHHVGPLLTGAPEVQLKSGPGGHLGVLTGRAAARTTWHWIDEFFARHEVAEKPRRRTAA
jgi:polyhydroxyalkanoate synthase subunit PhaC